jgi:hypothetical protein
MDETIEHLLCECEHYSELLWNRLGEVIEPQAQLGQHNITFNVPHPSQLLHNRDKITRNIFILLTQEIKRDI